MAAAVEPIVIEDEESAKEDVGNLVKHLHNQANRPDANLGHYKIGPSLCRVAYASSVAVMRSFSRAEAMFLPPSQADIERHFVDLGSGRGLVCLAALAAGMQRATGWELDEVEHAWARNYAESAAMPSDWRARLDLVNADATRFSPREASAWWGAFNDNASLAAHQRVFIYCFSKDWPPASRAAVIRRLIHESEWWSVFITSDRNLRATLEEEAEERGVEEADADECDALATLVRGPVDFFTVCLSASRERHRLYVYISETTAAASKKKRLTLSSSSSCSS